MIDKSRRNGALIVIATIVMSALIVKFPGFGPSSSLQAGPEPEWYPVPEPVRHAVGSSDSPDGKSENSIAQAVLDVPAGQKTVSIIHVAAALEVLSGAVSEWDESVVRPLFGTDFDWQTSQTSLAAHAFGPAIPLPPILDGSEARGNASFTENDLFSEGQLIGNSQPLASEPVGDPFLESDENFVRETPGVIPSVAVLYQTDAQPTPANLIPPPAAGDDPQHNDQRAAAERLFQKRVGELNRSMAGIQLGYSSEKGAFPPNQAAQLAPELPPLFVTGANGWFEPRPNRYPVPFAYQPLYYEEINLERCGIGHGFLQPFCSSAAFVKNTIMLPYQLVVNPPLSLVETPGDCPSCHRFPCRCKERAAIPMQIIE